MKKCYAILCLASGLLVSRAQGQACNAAFVDSVHGANLWVSAAQTSPTASSYYDFGDGQSAFGYSTNHTYATPGTYTISHYVNDSINHCADTATQSVTLRFTVCAVSYQAILPQNQDAPETISFVAQPSPGDPQGPKTYSWNISDTVVSTLDSFSYTFSQPGPYSVTLTMQADSGCVASYTENFYVANPDSCNLSVDFTDYADSSNNLLYHFYANPNDSSYRYYWSFGDGSTGSSATVSHQYAAKGLYVATLMITAGHAPDSCTALASHNVNADSSSPQTCYIIVGDSAVGDNGTKYAFFAQPSAPILSQTWVIAQMPDSNFIVTLHTNNPTYQFPDSGTYEISCVGQTTSGCYAVGYAWVSIQGDSILNRNAGSAVPALTSYPDPVQDQATINVKLPGNAPISLTVYNAEGQPVGHIETSGVSGDNQISIPAAALSKGMYFVRIISGNLQMQSRFQKQ